MNAAFCRQCGRDVADLARKDQVTGAEGRNPRRDAPFAIVRIIVGGLALARQGIKLDEFSQSACVSGDFVNGEHCCPAEGFVHEAGAAGGDRNPENRFILYLWANEAW